MARQSLAEVQPHCSLWGATRTHRVPLAFIEQSVQLPENPQVVAIEPFTHVPCVVSQQNPPLHEPAPATLQADVQAPAAQVGVPKRQVLHAPPLVPQALLAVPGWQLPPLQQPSLHTVWLASPQTFSHRCVAMLHAVRDGQSVAKLQPQLPPRHALPCVPTVQSAHWTPLVPHAVSANPSTHAPPLQQPPPLQALWLASPHTFSHRCSAVLQAVPEGQSAAALQPQRSRLATHEEPIALPVQSAQSPLAPHASLAVPGWHEPPPQQPLLHAIVGPHALLHR